MLNVVFLGNEGALNRAAAHALSQRANLVGCVWFNPEARWHTTWKGRLDFFRRRLKRRGLLKTIDEIGFFLMHHATDKRAWSTERAYELVDRYFAAHPAFEWPRQHYTTNVNGDDVLSFLAEVKADVIFSHCLNQYFSRRLREVTRLGLFMWHDGITPEYKGLYAPFWVINRGDFENFGCTLLRVNGELDAGEIYTQTRISNIDVERESHILIEHKALIAAFDDLGPFLERLENGTAQPILRPKAPSGYYSYPGLTDFIRTRMAIRRLKRERGTTVVGAAATETV